MDYIAFIAGLPEIDWDDRKLSLTVAEFREQLKDYISGRAVSYTHLTLPTKLEV